MLGFKWWWIPPCPPSGEMSEVIVFTFNSIAFNRHNINVSRGRFHIVMLLYYLHTYIFFNCMLGVSHSNVIMVTPTEVLGSPTTGTSIIYTCMYVPTFNLKCST